MRRTISQEQSKASSSHIVVVDDNIDIILMKRKAGDDFGPERIGVRFPVRDIAGRNACSSRHS